MPQTGTELLSYRGDAGLGLGANADIPAINPKANLDIINQAARDILLLNHENNIRLYQQKINDRDNTLKLLAEGQVSSGDIDPNDRVYYDQAKKDAKDAFFKMIKSGGLNNPNAVKEYYDKVGTLKDVAVHAQGRQLEWKKLEQEKANQVLPDDIAMYDNHIKTERGKDFWQTVNPIQKAFDLNLPSMTSSIAGNAQTEGQVGQLDDQGLPTATTQWNTVTDKNGVITQKQTTKTAPLRSARITKPAKGVATSGTVVGPGGALSEISYTPEKYWDYPTMLKNAQEQYVSDPTQRQNQIEWFKNVMNYDDPQKLKLLQAYNNRIEDYSKERGIQSDKINSDGTLHYPDQINYGADPSGKILIQETPSSFAAKHTLASIEGNYVEKPKAIFDKDIAAYKINKQKADSDAFYKRAMAGAANTKARAYADNLKQQMKLRKDVADQDNFLDELWTRNLDQQKQLAEGTKAGIQLSAIPADNSLPVFTLSGKNPIQLQPIGAKAHTDLKTGKFEYWEGGHYDPQYILDGKPLTGQKMSELYINYVGQANKNYKAGIAPKWEGDVNDFIKAAVKNNLIEYQLKGANGVTDRKLSNAAQRIISNASTKKGQTAIFDANGVEQPPLDEQIPDDNTQ